jgi:hypothetical protein
VAPVTRIAFLVATMAALSQASLGAQEPRVHVGAGAVYARPAGSLGSYIGDAYGAGGWVELGGRGRRLSVRLDADYLHFAPTIRAFPHRGTTPAVIATGSRIFLFTAGPQVQARLRRVRLAAAAGAGFARLTTTGSVSLGSLAGLNRSTTFDDLTYAFSGTGGVAVCLGGPGAPLWLALAARYTRIGPSRWVREGNLPVGTISGVYLNPTWSTSAQWIYRLGLSLGVGG